MPRILGIDPGSVLMGYGVIDHEAGKLRYVASGCLRLPAVALPQRLHIIYSELGELIGRHSPDESAVEQVFVNQNVASALKLGHARGAAICALAAASLPVHEYTPAAIKQAVVGHGRAEKAQIQHMVKVLLNLPARLQADAADALAVAICHANMGSMRSRGVVLRRRR